MKTLIKRVLMSVYCRGWISVGLCQRIYDFLKLSRH